jgi:DNA primase
MDSQVQEIKDKLNITEVLGQYVQLHKAGRTFTARCPFHKEKTPSFHVSPERGTYICFGCGERGDVFSFVQKMESIDFPTALKQLAERAGVVLKQYKGPVESVDKDKEERLREACEAATAFFESTLAARPDVQEYLTKRGVHEESKKIWRLGYAPATWHAVSEYLATLGFSKDEIVEAGLAARSEKKPGDIYDRFRGRIMFPICDPLGRVIAFSGRYFEKVEGSREEGEPAKYVNSPETELFKKSKILYGFDKAKNAIRKADCMLLVEGQFDLVLAHQSGLPFTVALSGTALTQDHIALLGRLSKRLVLALDADQAGLRSGLKSTAMAFAAGFDVKIPTFPEGKDPADIAKEDPEALRVAVRQSKTAIEFFLDVLRATLPQGRQGDERVYKKVIEAQVLPLIAALQSRIDQAHFIRIVAERLRVPEEAVRAEVAKRPVLPNTEDMVSTHVPQALVATPIERKVGMLFFYFDEASPQRQRLLELFGADRLAEIQTILVDQAERLRFDFEREVGEHSTAEVIADDLLENIESFVSKEKLRRRFL